MKPHAVARAVVSALAFALLLAGCESKVTQANYDRITEGMKEEQVQKILGIGSESRSQSMRIEDTVFTSTQTKWRGDKGTIVVLFLNGEVQQKIFYPPGAEPPPERPD